ncbi:MAG TPA: class I SAM-dependent methyltransferase [Candidatus Hydrogenedentes bacterium]|nr:class I SAM-dependent methyltransferase [Candidatus Hydrogenedentota bacterium]HQH51409.1 class I SAM-dependent methyltransferase [Candidatus Hydrogenedentota bacterium]HQM48538.1 class I SAM-dependent methyltransferase [Candidatus Hydrogenedentota bacterium]
MARITNNQDAYGRLIHDYYNGCRGLEIDERGDGYIAVGSTPGVYFAEYKDWPPFERRAIQHAKGRVLDVGCGAGRVALYLQQRGCEVIGIDVSPLAIATCRKRGVRRAKVMSATDVSPRLGRFRTIVMYGNNFGLCASARRARWLLRRFHTMTTDDAKILAASNDIYQTDDPAHLAYQRHNRARGRMSGQIRLRIRYRTYATPWFDYLMVSPDEMAMLAESAGWRLAGTVHDNGPLYAGVLEKAPRSG